MNKNIVASLAGLLIIFLAFYAISIDNEKAEVVEEERDEESLVATDKSEELEDLEEVKVEGEIKEELDEEAMDSFIQCLKEEGVAIYGSAWCPYCKTLAESLGGYDIVDPIYTECTEEEKKCREEMIGTAVPEIQIKGEVYRGSRDPEKMAEVTGCRYYR